MVKARETIPQIWGFPEIGVPWGTPKSSTLMGFSMINHPFGGTPISRNHQILNSSILVGTGAFFSEKP